MIQTRSRFYYGFEVTPSSPYLQFDEGAGELTAQLRPGFYSSEELMNEVSRAMNEAGDETYTVTFNRSTRRVTIAGTASFDLLWQSGSQAGQSVGILLGFGTGPDSTGASSYLAPSVCGFVYTPQLWLQGYVSTDYRQKAIDASINISVAGKVEVVRFGVQKFMECDINYITDVPQGPDSPIESNATGVSDYLAFIQYAVNKAPIEFMPDRDDVTDFQVLILESTEEDKDGVGYRLKEEYDRGLSGYFKSGRLIWRLRE